LENIGKEVLKERAKQVLSLSFDAKWGKLSGKAWQSDPSRLTLIDLLNLIRSPTMSSQYLSLSRVSLIGGFVVVASWLAFAGSHPGNAGQPLAMPKVSATAPGDAPPAERPDDRAAIEKALAGFSTAFKNGDGKAVAALWTSAGEYIDDDGTTITGRASLEKAYVEFFAKNPDNTLEVEVESIRFPSRDNAIAEGYFKLHKGKKKELIVSKCSFLYAREDGKWLIAVAREWPGDGLSLRDLEWLIGSWEVKRNGTVVTTKYEWTTNRTFIRCHISITQEGKTVTAMQMIGKMPSTGGLCSWTFEDDGGIGDADITREGKRWMFTTRASTADGRVLAATNILTPGDAESFTWQTVERTADGEELPDLPQVKVTRVKARQ
jgi:uncharacterized protein (TIGR02246 family)